MKRLRILIRLFGTITLALLARLLKTRFSAAGVAAPALVGALLVGSVWLSHVGHRVELEPETQDAQ